MKKLYKKDCMTESKRMVCVSVVLVGILFQYGACDKAEKALELSDQEIDNIVRRSYQYVAMYNVNNKFALEQGAWNTVVPDTKLKDHTMRDIARPNNDTLYIGCMLDLPD